MEQQRKAREEEMRQKMEAEKKAKEEQLRRMREMEQKRKEEQTTMMAIRAKQVKVKNSTPETFEAAYKDLEQALATDIQKIGIQQATVTVECKKVMEEAKKRYDAIMEQRRLAQEKKEAEEKKRKELEEKAQGFIKELTDLIEAAEAESQKLKDAADAMTAESEKEEADLKIVEKIEGDINSIFTAAKDKGSTCTNFILEKGPQMKEAINTVPASAPSAPIVPGAVGPASTKQQLASLLNRINASGKANEGYVAAGKAAKDNMVRKATARKKTKALEATFVKYDKDKDKVLSEAELSNYLKLELKVAVDKELLTKIMKSAVEEGQKGVSFENLYLVNATVGIVKEMQRDAKRRAEREAREKVINAMKDKLKEKVKAVRESAKTLEKELASIEESVAPLLAKVRTTSLSDVQKEAAAIEKSISAGQVKVTGVKKKVDAIPQGLDDKHENALREFIKQDLKHLELRVSRHEKRLSRATNLTKTYREKAEGKQAADVEKVRAFAMKLLRQHAKVNNLSMDEIFKSMDKNKANKIDEKQFLSFFASIDKELKEDEEEVVEPAKAEADQKDTEEGKDGEANDEAETKPTEAANQEAEAPEEKTPIEQVDLTPAALKSFFSSELESGSKAMPKAVFDRLAKLYYKVVHETPITEEIEVNGDNAKRSLKVSEVVEVLEGPKKTSGKILRAKCRAISDGVEGWVTVTGNKGTKLLDEGAHIFKVMKQTHLSDSCENTEVEDGARRLKQGEVLVVLEMPKKIEESGLFRMQVRTRHGGVVGWLTQQDKEGNVFAEPV